MPPDDGREAMKQNLHQRDKIIARLAAADLRSGGPAADAACPDSEVLRSFHR